MSKIGKKPVLIPSEAEVFLEKEQALVKGPLGEVLITIPDGIKVEKNREKLILSCWRQDKRTRSCYGTTRSLLANAFWGVVRGWEKELEVIGTGYKVAIVDNQLVLTLGFSHPVNREIPQGLKVTSEENKIKIKGVDRQQVGLFAAQLRKVSPPDAYQGKGIRYVDEEVKLKPGKMAKTGTSGEA